MRSKGWLLVLLLTGALVVLTACEEQAQPQVQDDLEARVSRIEATLQGIQAQLEVPTPTPLPTATPAPTATPQPTATPYPTPTPPDVPVVTAVPTASSAGATVNADNGLNVRAEPTTEAEVLRVLDHESEVSLTGRSATSGDADWVELEDGGWVQSQYLIFN
ncbi:MAG: SH3 domain-containing protein [Chloroflexi bacterium]|nr:SH3 domain-containing protein [Chloroflexota bacterium]MCY3938927.1 SH3 domain-containing protein [Chloroflexota bacterium]